MADDPITLEEIIHTLRFYVLPLPELMSEK
jgi:hypothetical protein